MRCYLFPTFCLCLLRDHTRSPSYTHCGRDFCEKQVASICEKDPEGGNVLDFRSDDLFGNSRTDLVNFSCGGFQQVGSITGFALIIIIAVVGGVLYQSSWVIAPSLWIIGTIYPFIGFFLGFLLARFVGQPWYR